MDYMSFLLYFVVFIPILMYLLPSTKNTDTKNIPPGPTPIPILGNLEFDPKPHVALAKLAQIHGPIMTLQLGQVKTIVLSSADYAKQALKSNDISFCNKRGLTVFDAENYNKYSSVWLPIGHQWRHIRKFCTIHILSTARIVASQHLRRNKMKDLLVFVENCSKSSQVIDIGQLVFATSLNLLSTTCFSEDLGDPDSEIAIDFKKTVKAAMEEGGKINFADYFPFLRRFDLQGGKRRMSVHLRTMIRIFNDMIEKRVEQIEHKLDSTQDCVDILDVLLRINHDSKDHIERSKIPYLLMDLFIGGTDTTSSTVEWAMAELLQNPNSMKKLKAELDEVVGKDKIVEEAHLAHLPYMTAVLKETLRLHPAVSLLAPRKVESDVKLSNYIVPKGYDLLVNVWAICRDPNTWENPNCFIPDRFLGSEIDFKGQHFELIPFGAGRRICIGYPLAIRLLPLMLGSLVHGFHWELEGGISPEKLDMEERFGITLTKAQPLRAIPKML
ncbi:unnamed protein product [Amaranthus hypochondriacus]